MKPIFILERGLLFSLFISTNIIFGQGFEEYEETRAPEMKRYFKEIDKELSVGNIERVKVMYDSAYQRSIELKDTISIVLSNANKGELLFMMGEMDQAKLAFEKVRPYASTLPFVEYDAYNEIRLGSVYKHLGQNDSAFYHLREAQELSKRTDEKPLLRQLNNQLGILFDAIGKGDSAVHYYLEALKTVDETEVYTLGALYTNLGKSFSYRYNFDKAIEYYNQVLNILSPEKYPKAFTIALINKATSLRHKDQNDQAAFVINRAIDMVNQHTLERLRIFTYSVKASILLKQNKLSEANALINEIAFFEPIKDKELLPEYLLVKTNVLMHNNKLDQIPDLLKRAAQSVQENNSLSYQIKLHQLKAKFYTKKKDFGSALAAMNNYNLYKDSLFKISQSNIIHDLEKQYETSQKVQRITQLELEDELQQTRISRQQSIIGFGLLGLLLVSLFLFYIYRQNKKIKSQNQLIEKSLKEKNILLKEIHHRVKNNLQVISSLLGIQSRQIKDKVALEAITEGRTRVQTMSLIHQNLYKDDNLTGIEIRTYLGRLSQSLFDTYNIKKDQIQLNLDIDDLMLDVESVVPLGLIINELISNALKYAFPENRDGLIYIQLKKIEEGLQLQVKDNGIGIEDTSKLFDGDSFGYDLIDAFKLKLNADLHIDGEGGTDVKMLIRNYKKAV